MMPLSRRRFLGMAAAVPLAVHQRLTGSGPIRPPDLEPRPCLLLDAADQCVLQESLTGFERGLKAASSRFERVSVGAIRPGQLVIIPGAVMESLELAKTIRRLTDSGSTVLYESAAAFSDHEAFEAERHLLRIYFGVSLEDPQELWPAKRQVNRVPYVRYRWPSHVMIRDFSRVIAVSGRSVSSSCHIAHIGTAPVACRQPIGRGAFIYLGSPLGPHVGFGDAEAQRLLESFVRL